MIERLPSDESVPHGTQGYAHYTTQRDHWLGWLDPNNKAGKYARSSGPSRDAKYAYNHIMEPKMLLWLISASGLPNSELEKAREEAQEKKAFGSKCAAIRRVVPWERIVTALSVGPENNA
ncbi:hypothetical protein [Pseudomonas sp. B392_1p]|uniref:hypothetical protein n=1 Tax=Pseudomonas sp. B392_1p TaxID=3457507 RepID=UPI003FD34A03